MALGRDERQRVGTVDTCVLTVTLFHSPGNGASRSCGRDRAQCGADFGADHPIVAAHRGSRSRLGAVSLMGAAGVAARRDLLRVVAARPDVAAAALAKGLDRGRCRVVMDAVCDREFLSDGSWLTASFGSAYACGLLLLWAATAAVTPSDGRREGDQDAQLTTTVGGGRQDHAGSPYCAAIGTRGTPPRLEGSMRDGLEAEAVAIHPHPVWFTLRQIVDQQAVSVGPEIFQRKARSR